MPVVEQTPEEIAKPPVNAPCAPTEPHPEEDTQIRHRMPVSDQRQPVGGQFLPTPARWQAKEIQRLRRNERAMRNQTRRDDRASKSGDCRREGKTKRGRRVTTPSKFGLQ